MTITFSTTLPLNYVDAPELISGLHSAQYNLSEYVLVGDNAAAFEIRYEMYCGPFREALIFESKLLVGCQCHFYMYDLSTKTNVLTVEMDGYFGHLYVNGEKIYVADISSLTCIDINGSIDWKSTPLAVDGVIVNEFTHDKILGSAECDPPGGWIDFILDAATGKVITSV